MSNNTIVFSKLLILLLLLLGAATSLSSEDPVGSRNPDRMFLTYHIHIINNLEIDFPRLLVHCKSRDDDLGARVMARKEEYYFKFKVNWFATTLFHCHVQWGAKGRRIDAFKASRDEHRCQRTAYCLWSVTEDGFFFSKDNLTWHFTYPW